MLKRVFGEIDEIVRQASQFSSSRVGVIRARKEVPIWRFQL